VRLQDREVHEIGGVEDLLRNQLGFVVGAGGISDALDPVGGFEPMTVAVAGVLGLVRARRLSCTKRAAGNSLQTFVSMNGGKNRLAS